MGFKPPLWLILNKMVAKSDSLSSGLQSEKRRMPKIKMKNFRI
jgi:hypothetical protein